VRARCAGASPRASRDGTARSAPAPCPARSRILLLFAGDADAGPRDGVQPRLGDGFAAIPADAVGTLIEAQQRFFNSLQDFRVGLLQFELNVDLVIATRLVGHVALAGVVLHRR